MIPCARENDFSMKNKSSGDRRGRDEDVLLEDEHQIVHPGCFFR